MSNQNEAHGDEDWVDAVEPTERHLELALDLMVETILDYGQYPAKGRIQFDLYDFLNENRDPSYALEMYVASMGINNSNFEERIERERKTVEAMLIDHLKGSQWVEDLAAEYAAEDE